MVSSGLKEEEHDQVRPKVTFCQALNHNGFCSDASSCYLLVCRFGQIIPKMKILPS